MITILNIVIVKAIFQFDFLSIGSALVCMWAATFYTFYFFILTNWYLNTNDDELSPYTMDLIAANENLKWYGIPALVWYGVPGFLFSFVMFYRNFHIIYNNVADVRTETIKIIKYLFTKHK